MAGLNLTLADAVLKDDYQGPVRNQINDDVMLASQVAKNRSTLTGRRAILPLHMSRNTGVGSRLEGEVMPEAGAQGYVDQIITLRSHYGRVRYTRQVISRMDSDQGAFLRATKSEMDGLKNDEGREYNRQLWGTSDGKLATCAVSSATNTIALNANTPEQTLVNLAEGSRVDIGTVANPQLKAANRKVTAVDFTNKTVTIDGGAITTATTDFLFRQGNGGSGANQRELTGVQSIVSDSGQLFGVDPATYWQWAAIREHNSGTLRPFSTNVLARAVMRTTNRSGSKNFMLVAEDGVYRAIANLLQGMQRAVNTLDLKAGHTAMGIGVGGKEYPLAYDRDAVPNKMFGFGLSNLIEYVSEDWQWEDLDGSVLVRSPDQTHTFEAIYYKFSEFATDKRNAHFVIEDLEAI